MDLDVQGAVAVRRGLNTLQYLWPLMLLQLPSVTWVHALNPKPSVSWANKSEFRGARMSAFLLREEEDKRQEATAHHFLYEIHTPPSSMHPRRKLTSLLQRMRNL